MSKLGLSWLIILVELISVSFGAIFPVTKQNDEWWSNKIIYQVYLQSFKDSNNDGIGDLKGLMDFVYYWKYRKYIIIVLYFFFFYIKYDIKNAGLTQKLDYFVDLGVEIIWINPIFKSPMDDMGFDVENYTMIDPIFGTDADFEKLITEVNNRGD